MEQANSQLKVAPRMLKTHLEAGPLCMKGNHQLYCGYQRSTRAWATKKRHSCATTAVRKSLHQGLLFKCCLHSCLFEQIMPNRMTSGCQIASWLARNFLPQSRHYFFLLWESKIGQLLGTQRIQRNKIFFADTQTYNDTFLSESDFLTNKAAPYVPEQKLFSSKLVKRQMSCV